MSEKVDSGWLMVDGKSENLAPPQLPDRRAVMHGSRGLQPTVPAISSILSHRDNGTGSQPSIQQIAVVQWRIVHGHKLSILLLERRLRMMLTLAGDVLNRVSHLRLPHRKRAVSVLPRKRLHRGPLPGNPFRHILNNVLSGTLFRCRAATQSPDSHLRVRGLKPTATVLDRSAVDSFVIHAF